MYMQTQYVFFTAPSGPKSINDDADAVESTRHCLPYLLPLIDLHDGFLVACYSDHPLVWALRQYTNRPVVGIFQASVTTSLQLISPHQNFGIVSTGDVWEGLLTNAVHKFIHIPTESNSNSNQASPFVGVETTGLNATDLHSTPTAEVHGRIKEATKRLLDRNHDGDVKAICLGCAGMVGMEEVVREACMEKLDDREGKTLVKVVDGVKAGVGILQCLVRGRF
jgi:Asp/Glu/hydantoin racemase